MNISRWVVWFSVRVELAIEQVEQEVKEVDDFHVCSHCDYLSFLMEYLGELFPYSISRSGTHIPKCCKTVIPVEPDVVVVFELLRITC